MRSESVRLLKTLPHPCGYFGERTAQNLVIDPLASDLPELFDLALTRGFRRAGGHIYRPACPRCRACVPARVPIEAFRMNRSQRRCAARNADLAVSIEDARYSDECFALYRSYLGTRHAGGGMDDAAADDFTRFLTSPWSPTRFVAFRHGRRLLAVAVTDFGRLGLSAVYTFYDPAEAARGLGTYAILRQIELARERGLPHLYLGYWIAGHAKMGYKARFRPLETLRSEGWVRVAESAPIR
jgi:arginine-tRNA-protein transferase